jgi:hypothetical protein
MTARAHSASLPKRQQAMVAPRARSAIRCSAGDAAFGCRLTARIRPVACRLESFGG